MAGEAIDYERLAEAIARRQTTPQPVLTMQQVEDVARRAAEAAVAPAVEAAIARTLISFGLDPSSKMETMRDFMFLRDMRTLSSDSKKHVLLAVLGVMTSGVVAAVWVYMKGTGKLP